MRKPRSVVVGQMRFKIIWNKDPSVMKKNKCLGMCNFTSYEIWIAADLTEESKRHVFLHEIFHAIWYSYGFNPRMIRKSIEEDIVCLFTPTFLQVMDDNPDVTQYLFGGNE